MYKKKEKNPKSNGPSLEDYKAIQLGENDGTSESELESKFGKPSTTSSQTIQNVKQKKKSGIKFKAETLAVIFL